MRLDGSAIARCHRVQLRRRAESNCDQSNHQCPQYLAAISGQVQPPERAPTYGCRAVCRYSLTAVCKYLFPKGALTAEAQSLVSSNSRSAQRVELSHIAGDGLQQPFTSTSSVENDMAQMPRDGGIKSQGSTKFSSGARTGPSRSVPGAITTGRTRANITTHTRHTHPAFELQSYVPCLQK